MVAVRFGRSVMGWDACAACIGMVAPLVTAFAQPSGLFTLPGGGPLVAEVRAGTPVAKGDAVREPVDPKHSSPMLRQLEGVLADLDDAGVRRLRAAVTNAAVTSDETQNAELWATVECRDARGGRAGFEIRRDARGRWFATTEPLPDDRPRLAYKLDSIKFFEAVDDWVMFRAGFADAGPLVPQQVIEVAHPLAASVIALDRPHLSRRLRCKNGTTLDGTARNLDEERFAIRVPKDYHPRAPVGALVWVHGEGDLEPLPQVLASADKLGLAVVSVALAGNARITPDRYQLMFDALQTLRERVHIDPRRIYITGISGGGKVAGILACCFPDVFCGSVPIIGMEMYEGVPLGNGMWSASAFDKPGSALFGLLKTRRMAAITGSQEPNQYQIRRSLAVLKRDGVPTRLFDIQGLKHVMPDEEVVTEAIDWIDEPAREAAAKHEAEAESMLADVKPDASSAEALVAITRKHPWTKAAWIAAQRLGFAPK